MKEKGKELGREGRDCMNGQLSEDLTRWAPSVPSTGSGVRKGWGGKREGGQSPVCEGEDGLGGSPGQAQGFSPSSPRPAASSAGQSQ